MKRVYFVYPPSEIMNREGRCQQPTKDLLVIPPLPPIELMYLASIARELGYECKIKDYSINSLGIDNFIEDIKEFKPDYIVSNVATPTLGNDLEVFRAAKQTLEKVTTIATGAHFLTFDKEVLESCKELDIAIRGESEFTLKEILENKDLSQIEGLSYFDGTTFRKNPSRPFIENLDQIPLPARELVDNAIFRRPDNNKIQTIIKVSRGCPYHCFFCLATPVSGTKVRVRSPKNIVAEIKECIEKYNIKDFIFWSDVFDFDRNWVISLCEEIINSKLKITWSANTRVDLIDDKLAKIMKKSGCKLISLGIESGSQAILDKIGKKTTLSQIKNAVKIFKKTGIKTYNYFVIGLPWETKEHIEQTIKFAIELNSDFVSFYTATVLPGSRFYNYVIENNLGNINQNDTYKKAYFYPSIPTHFLSKEEVFELHKKAMKKFYLRPSYILKKILSIRSLAEIKNYFTAGISLILKK